MSEVKRISSRRDVDMTEGNIFRHLVSFAIPLLLGNIFQQMYNLVDSVIVGKFVGAQALAAVGASGSVTFMFFALLWGISGGAGVITSQCFGGGNEDRVKRSVANAAYIMIFSSILIIFLILAMVLPSLLSFL